jgi:hypothetical protein
MNNQFQDIINIFYTMLNWPVQLWQNFRGGVAQNEVSRTPQAILQPIPAEREATLSPPLSVTPVESIISPASLEVPAAPSRRPRLLRSNARSPRLLASRPGTPFEHAMPRRIDFTVIEPEEPLNSPRLQPHQFQLTFNLPMTHLEPVYANGGDIPTHWICDSIPLGNGEQHNLYLTLHAYINSFAHQQPYTEQFEALNIKLNFNDNAGLLCPVTHDVMDQPVRLGQHAFDYQSLKALDNEQGVRTNPLTRAPFRLTDITPAPDIKEAIEKYLQDWKLEHGSTPKERSKPTP